MKLRYYILCAIYCAGIFILSSRPVPDVPGIDVIGIDKAAHMVIFGGLAVLVAVGLRRSNATVRPRIQYLVPLAVAIGYGATDELHQAIVPWRTADPYDFAADALGALIAVVLLCRGVWRIPFSALKTGDCNPAPENGIQ